jgi:hypothetical protein
MEFLVPNSHTDFFLRGQLAIRAEMRAAFICTRQTVVCELTGLMADSESPGSPLDSLQGRAGRLRRSAHHFRSYDFERPAC